jgi:hypothetical protein
LAIVKHRDARALAGFVIEQGRRWCRGVEVVVTDGSESYTAAIGWHRHAATPSLTGSTWFAGAPGARSKCAATCNAENRRGDPGVRP